MSWNFIVNRESFVLKEIQRNPSIYLVNLGPVRNKAIRNKFGFEKFGFSLTNAAELIPSKIVRNGKHYKNAALVYVKNFFSFFLTLLKMLLLHIGQIFIL